MSPEEVDELRALAERLLSLTGAQGEGLMFSSPPQSEPMVDLLASEKPRYSNECLLIAAKGELERRKSRRRFLPSEFFAEGAWNILVDLFENEHLEKDVSITSACIAAEVPHSTALRNIGQLVECGLAMRVPDPRDQRRVFLTLSNRGRKVMREVLSSMIDSEIALGRTLPAPEEYGK